MKYDNDNVQFLFELFKDELNQLTTGGGEASFWRMQFVLLLNCTALKGGGGSVN